MEKPILKRILLGIVQHIVAAGMVLSAVYLFVNIHVETTNYMGEPRSYIMNPLDNTSSFEDTELFGRIYKNAIQDIIKIVVIKEQLELDGYFDLDKQINCTEYINRKEPTNSSNITAIYSLNDLLKWQVKGLEYEVITMTKSDFVFYFDWPDPIHYYFYVDEYNELQFTGYRDYLTEKGKVVSMPKDIPVTNRTFNSYEDLVSFVDYNYSNEVNYNVYQTDVLTDIIYNYIKNNSNTTLLEEVTADGTEIVQISILKNQYPIFNSMDNFGLTSRILIGTDEYLDDSYQELVNTNALLQLASNWVSYFELENNVVNAISELSYNNRIYQNSAENQPSIPTNLLYLFQLPDENGDIKTYTNIQDYIEPGTEDAYFSSKGKFLYYDYNSKTSSGMLDVSSQDIVNTIDNFSYFYPDDTRLWIGIDTLYTQNDQFKVANIAYEKIAVNIWKIVAVFLGFFFVYLNILCYLAYTAGRAYTEDGAIVLYLNGFDKLLTEVLFTLGVVVIGGGIVGGLYLVESLKMGQYYWPIKYLYIIVFGMVFIGSLLFSIVFYSFIRRRKSKNLWKGSLLYLISIGCIKLCKMILRHPNSAIRTIIPYCTFCIFNIIGIIVVLKGRPLLGLSGIFLFSIGIVLLDMAIGFFLFQNNIEVSKLMEGLKKIRQGEVEYEIKTKELHGINRKMAEDINNIGEGIRNAVESSMKDERMKTDLITNVSHDIKTPLTSIVNYVDLLKRENIETEPVKGYIEILDSKSQRLKQLTDDLVEASKISSGNIELENEKLNLTELINQANGEFSEKFNQKELAVYIKDDRTPAYIYADSRRMWRIFENLLNNICKYAMPNTRIYIDTEIANGLIEMSIKNISEQRLNIGAEELTERFIRGDIARTTEGSGLGLSIAQSLVEAQGGTFRIVLDGDLFKVIIRFSQYVEPELISENEEMNELSILDLDLVDELQENKLKEEETPPKSNFIKKIQKKKIK